MGMAADRGGGEEDVKRHAGEVVLKCLKMREDRERGEAGKELMWRFLRVASSENLEGSIRDIVKVRGSLEFLYGFIVERSEREARRANGVCGPSGGAQGVALVNVFGTLVGAMEVLDWDADLSGVEVKVLQMFVSRSTMQERMIRKRMSPADRSRLVVQNAWREVDGGMGGQDLRREMEGETRGGEAGEEEEEGGKKKKIFICFLKAWINANRLI